MSKCEICGRKIGEIFLGKLVGTVVTDSKGKKHFACSGCQGHLGSGLKEKFQ